MAKHNVHLFVGFGGSGGKSLATFAELASQNRRWAEEAHKNCYFLLCDTNLQDLEDQEKRIHDAFQYVGLEPEVQVVGLADNVDDLQDSIQEAFDNASPEGLEQLKKCWWYDDDKGRPFLATGLGGHPNTGAGQCPAVAHFLAWRSYRRLEDSIKSIYTAINKTHMTGGRFPSLDVTFVSSLAGGTGRGAWPILGFLIRKTFKEAAGSNFAPQGYFLDQSCFPEVGALSALQKTKITVNSLTGFSELCMWVRNDNESLPTDPILYWAPSLESPEEPSQNIITINPSNTFMSGKSPIKSAWIIFNESKSGGMDRSDDYYEMVAGCLYSQVCTGLAATMNNEDPVIGSAASARYEVSVKDIRDYLRDQVIVGLCDDYAKKASREVTENGANNVTKRWNFSMAKFGHSLEEDAWSGKFAKEISKAQKPEGLYVLMGEQDVDETQARAAKFSKPNKELVARAILKVLGWPSDSLSPQEIVKEAVCTLIEKDIREAGKYMPLLELQSLSKSLESSLKKQAKDLDDMSSTTSSEVTKFIKRVKEKDGPLEKLKGIFFSEAEIKEARRVVPMLIAQDAGPAVAGILSGACEYTATKLHMWSGNIESAQSELSQAKIKYQDRLDKMKKTLFTIRKENGDWDIGGDKDVIYNARRLVQRKLRPALSNDLIKNIQIYLMGSDSVKQKRGELEGGLLGNDLRQGAQINQAEYRRKLEKQLEGIHQSLNIDDKTMEAFFSIDNVVKGLLKAWGELLKEMPESSDRARLKQLFKMEFGLELGYDNASKKLFVPELDDVLVSMTFSLAKTCDAFFKLARVSQDRKDEGDTVYVSIPNLEVFKNLNDEFKNEKRYKEAGLNGVAFKPELNHFTSNPFVIAAFTHEGVIQPKVSGLTNVHDDAIFDNIVSLNYWKRDPGILEWLRLCESQAGEAFFKGISNLRGLGYSDPRYVKDPIYANKRWKPWSLERPGEEQDRLDSLDCQLYGLLGNLPESDFTDEQYENCKRTIADVSGKCSDWTMPCIVKKDNNFFFARRPMQKDTSQANPICLRGDVWNEKKIGSIVTLTKTFLGDDGVAPQYREAMLGESQLFESELVGSIVGTENLKLLRQALMTWLIHNRDNIKVVAQGADWELDYDALIARLKQLIEG